MFWPETNGEDRFIAMFTLKWLWVWRMYRNFLQGSGWTNVMAQAGIVSSVGIADSLLRASHLPRITHANKMYDCFKVYCKNYMLQFSYNLKKYKVHDEPNEKGRQEPTFQYWHGIQFLLWNSLGSYSHQIIS